jgi:hypothetical protein
LEILSTDLCLFRGDQALFSSSCSEILVASFFGQSDLTPSLSYIDPTLEHDLGSQTKPWALSPLISTMPNFEHVQVASSDAPSPGEGANGASIKPSKLQSYGFPPSSSIGDDTSQLHRTIINNDASSSGEESDTNSVASGTSNNSSGGKSTGSRSSIKDGLRRAMGKRSRKQRSETGQETFNFANASERRAYFSDKAHRQAIQFGPEVRASRSCSDFCFCFYGLTLPGRNFSGLLLWFS